MTGASLSTTMALALFATGCDQPPPPHPSDNPGTQDMAAALAHLSGRVLDQAGAPVAGAMVRVIETGASATSAADGAFALDVPGETTVILLATLDGMAPTRVQALHLPAGGTSGGLDVYLLPQAKVDAANALAGGSSKSRAVVAVMVESVGGKCSGDGATIAIEPSYAGSTVYAQPGNGGIGDPDPQRQAAAPGALVAAYLVSVVPPSTYYTVSVTKAGCPQVPFPVTAGGRVYAGGFQVAAGGLTQFNVFVE